MSTASLLADPPVRFTLPLELSAAEPPEARGLARDEVRLMVAGPDGIEHATFRDLGRFLRAEDLVVVNTSATIPAAVDGSRAGRHVVVHFSAPCDDGSWVIELRTPDGTGPLRDGEAGGSIDLPGGTRLRLLSAYPDPGAPQSRLRRARLDVEAPVEMYLARYGRPIVYGYVRGRWPLAAYQTVFGREPGSAEMPSAGRPFTERLVTELVANGVLVAPVLLHCGVSSLEEHESLLPERYRVPAETARLVNHARSHGGRVVTIGTTVTRALETVADPDGFVRPGEGWTDLVLGSDRPGRVVDGIVTGWHAPDASHLRLLEAVAGADLVRRAYDSALESRYLWHEFGDSALLFA